MTTPTPDKFFIRESYAINDAIERSARNESPVAVVYRGGWYGTVESAEVYEDLTTLMGWDTIALVDPPDARTR